MAYQYDVFLSYSRMPIHHSWVNDIFLELFEPYLTETLNQKVRIFKDDKEIESGQDWSNRIKSALAHSKCMISIYTPAYFRSEWCVKEFAIMDYRQQQLGFTTLDDPRRLILPINIFDGVHFPKYATRFQYVDFRDFIWKGIEKTQPYIDFQRELLTWVEQVAKAINECPDWNADWLQDEWLEKPHLSYPINNNIQVQQPLLA